MATKSYTLTATAGNDSRTINEPNSNDQWKYVWNGLAGTDSLSFDRLPKSDFTIYKDATGIHVDSVSTASHMIYVTLNNVETLKFSDGATTVNLSALFDTVAPTLISATPADEAVAVPLASNLILTFSETVHRGTGNIVLRNASGTVIETYNAATSANLSLSAAVLTVNPSANLSAGTSYYLELAAGTITDASGNAYAGTQIYNFTTVSGNNLPTGSVNIAGTATQGQQLTATNSLADLDGLGVISYQWKANGTAIPGATSSTYTLTHAEVGKAITVTATYSDAQGTSESKTSAATSAVLNVNDLPTGRVSITGSATQGQQLTVSHTLADLDGLGAISYQWKADGTAISGATASKYTLTQAEVGKAITVTVSYIDAFSTAESVSSTATDLVLQFNNVPINQIIGTSGNDYLQSTVGNDSISAGAGTDTVVWNGSSSNFELSYNNGSWQIKDWVSTEGTDIVTDVERLQFANKTVIVESKAHDSYEDLPDTLYQFFVVGFGAAAGVTYMNQMAEAYRYWLPNYGDGTVKQIVEVFTTKTQFTGVYSEALYREDHGKYYQYNHDTSQPGSPLVKISEVSKEVFDEKMAVLAQKLIDTIVMQSAMEQDKVQAVQDVKDALGLGGDWTIGKVVYTIFGNLANKSPSDSSWGGTAIQFSNQVAVSKYYTDVLNQSTDNLQTLRDVMQSVTNTSDVSSTDAIVQLIGVALMDGGEAM